MSNETEKEDVVSDFIKLCVPRLSREYTKALADRACFTTAEWLRVYDHCQSDWTKDERCYNMQVIAMGKAVAVAKTLADWIAIASRKSKHREIAFDKIVQYEPTEENIEMFMEAQCQRLCNIGWYLARRLEYKKKNPAR